MFTLMRINSAILVAFTLVPETFPGNRLIFFVHVVVY